MKRTSNSRNTPNVKPVIKVELSEKNARLRLAVVILFVAAALAAFSYGILSFLNGESGWTQIEASSSAEINCGEDFVFQYHVGSSGASASAETKALSLLYTDATVKAYQLFNNDETFEEWNNVRYINDHPNEVVTVDPVLYDAFSMMEQYGSRNLYLAEVYRNYENLFLCVDEALTYEFDPFENTEIADYMTELAGLAVDASAVSVELLGENQVILHVSEEYLAYAEENYVKDFIDFSWMKNAFIVDYLAEVMMEHGYTFGSISSVDGFIRNLDDSGNQYAYTINDLLEKTIYPAASMNYSGAQSIVYLHDYPTSDANRGNYFEMKNGETRTLYIDPADGLCKASVHNLVSYSTAAGCAEILLRISPIYIADTLNTDLFETLAEDSIFAIYGQQQKIYYNDSDLELTSLYGDDKIQYETEMIP